LHAESGKSAIDKSAIGAIDNKKPDSRRTIEVPTTAARRRERRRRPRGASR
jgi:hypothetical protein